MIGSAEYGWCGNVMLAFDLVVVHYLSHKLLHYTMVMLSSSVFVIYLYSAYLRQLNRMLAGTMSIRVRLLRRRFRVFEREHSRSISYLLYSNRFFWKKVALVAFGCNLPVNIYFISYLFKKDTRVNSAIISIDVFLQFLLLTVAFVPVGNLSAHVHRSSRYMARLQHRLAAPTRAKLRVLGLYELVHSHSKVGIGLGDLVVITNAALFQVITRARH